jgi:hypothetical protein
MTPIQNTTNLNVKKNMFSSYVLLFSAFCLIMSGISGFFFIQKQFDRSSQAAVINSCTKDETKSGANCTIERPSQKNYAETCAAGLTKIEAVCAKIDDATCASFTKGTDAETGKCKFSDTNIFGGEIMTYDGRQCDGPNTSFYRYNVGQSQNSTAGPIVCSNIYSLVQGKETYRWQPKKYSNLEVPKTTETAKTYLNCPTGYTVLEETKCARSVIATGCDQGGEYFDNNSCKVCPAGQYCPTPTVGGGSTAFVCANGGNIGNGDQTNKCVAAIKYSYTEYTDSCDASKGYKLLDQTCAILQIRDRDLGCTFFYASNAIYAKAVTEADGKCSTGGRSDFENTDIFKVSDLQCAGPGTAWYNYNVGYDPLICGNIYDPANKAAFRWFPETYTSITGLQKVGAQKKICPTGWTTVDTTSDNCFQDPLKVETKNPIDCPINTYCPEKSTQPTNCPTDTTSPAKSTKVEDCKGSTTTTSSSSVASSSKSSSSIVPVSGPTIIITASSATPVCDNAQPGFYVQNGNCIKCPAGYYCVGGKEAPKICPIGSYCPEGSASPTKCPEGKTTVSEGSKSIEACIAIVTVTNSVATPTAALTTTRTGGLDDLATMLLFGSLGVLSYIYYDNTYRKNSSKMWKKI